MNSVLCMNYKSQQKTRAYLKWRVIVVYRYKS